MVDGIVAAREAHGKAVNFHGFLDQVPLVVCNKRVIESLIKAGAFESMGHSRRALMTVYEGAVDGVLDLKRNEANGQDDLFGELATDPVLTGSVPDLPDWDKRTKLAEREMLGLYVSDHPLQGLEHILAAERDMGIGELLADDGPRESTVTIAGMITNITRKTTRRGDIWAVITVEDLEASIEVLLFPKAYEMVSTVLATDTVVKIKGRVKVEDDVVSLNASELSLPDITDTTKRTSDDLVVGGVARRSLCNSCVMCWRHIPVSPRYGYGPAGGQDDRDEARRAAEGEPIAAADGRSQGVAGSVVSGVLSSPTGFPATAVWAAGRPDRDRHRLPAWQPRSMSVPCRAGSLSTRSALWSRPHRSALAPPVECCGG